MIFLTVSGVFDSCMTKTFIQFRTFFNNNKCYLPVSVSTAKKFFYRTTTGVGSAVVEERSNRLNSLNDVSVRK